MAPNLKNVLQKNIKDLTFELSDPSNYLKITSYKGPKFYEVHMVRGWVCHVFTDFIVFE